MIKLYSTLTKQIYDTEEELKEAEQKLQEEKEAEEKKKEERRIRAKEIDDALKAVTEAEKKANKLIKEFCNDYGSYHTSINKDCNFSDLHNIFSRMFYL